MNRLLTSGFPIILLAVMLILPHAAALPPIAAEFYGNVTYRNGTEYPAGTVITAYDQGWTLCGRFVMVYTGKFGLLSCNGDDLNTTTDEGAVDGEIVKFKIGNLTAGTRQGNRTWYAGIFSFLALTDNLPPVLDYIGNLNATEDFPFYYDVNASDPNEDTLNFSVTFLTNRTVFSIASDTGIINFTPTNDDVGTHVVRITVSDGLDEDYEIINFTVFNVNDQPFFDPNCTNQNLTEDSQLLYDINATDIDIGDNLTYYDNMSQFNISNTTGMIDWTPNWPDIGNWSVNVTVCDDSHAWNNCTSCGFNITVYERNDPPVLQPIGPKYLNVNLRFTYQVNATDEEGAPLIFQAINLTNKTLFTISSTGLIDFTPTIWDIGVHLYNLTVSDNFTTVFEAVTFTVNPALFCGDGLCSIQVGENCLTCPQDCGACIPAPEAIAKAIEAAAAAAAARAAEAARARAEERERAIIEEMLRAKCKESWVCTNWTECMPIGIQTRNCTDLNRCGTKEKKPEDILKCVYIPPPTCFDGIPNQGELGIDCGGPCPPCIVFAERRYATLPFVRRYLGACGNHICDFLEECTCPSDCRSFPKTFPWRLLETVLLVASIAGAGTAVYFYRKWKRGEISRERYLKYTGTIFRLYGAVVLFTLILSLLIYLFAYCLELIIKALLTILLFSAAFVIASHLIYEYLFGYTEERKIRHLKRMSRRHLETLNMLIVTEGMYAVEIEQKFSRQIVNLVEKKSNLIKMHPQLVSIYNMLRKIYTVKDDAKLLEEAGKRFVEMVDELRSQPEYQESVKLYPRMENIDHQLELLKEHFVPILGRLTKLVELYDRFRPVKELGE